MAWTKTTRKQYRRDGLRYASDTQPAKFLVLLIKDKGAPALVPAE